MSPVFSRLRRLRCPDWSLNLERFESFMQALDGMASYDAGGYVVGFSPTNHNGSSYVELAVIGKNLTFSY